MRRARTWKQLQDEKAIREAELKKRMEEKEKDPLIENLKKEGNIKEAAAVFSYEGFRWLINSIGDIVAQKIEPMIDRKITEIFEGLQEGIAEAVEESSKSIIENIIAKKIEEQLNFGTSEEEVKHDTELPTITYTGVKIPRSHKGILWSKLNEEEQRQIFLHYIGMAKEVGADRSTNKFKKFHPESNAIYQRINKVYGKGGFEKLKKEYEEKYEVTN